MLYSASLRVGWYATWWLVFYPDVLCGYGGEPTGGGKGTCDGLTPTLRDV